MERRIQHELALITDDKITFHRDDNIIHFNLRGPDNTPYSGGYFSFYINLIDNYPFNPPIVHWDTPIYHPNICSGKVCCCVINLSEWAPTFNLVTIIERIYEILQKPLVDYGSCGNRDIITLYNTDREKFNNIATQWTQNYAK